MVEASALRRTVRGQPQQTEQGRTGKAGQRWISRAEQATAGHSRTQQATVGRKQADQQQSRRSDPATALNPGEGVWSWTPRGYESCQGLPALRIGSENSFTVPIQFPLRSNFCISTPNPQQRRGNKEITLWLCGHFFMCISFPLIMRQHLLSSSGMRVRSAALLRADPQSHFDCTKEMKAAWL